MRLLRGIGCVFVTATVILSASGVTAQDSDGPSPYDNGHADDVTAVDMPWNGEFPSFEGTEGEKPHLDDAPDVSTNSSLDLSRRSLLDAFHRAPDVSRRAAKDFYLRVMPLGASITQGVQSSDGNGYRKWLRSQLRWKGWSVNMVGSKQDGEMADKDNEGHPGWIVTTVHEAFQASKYMMPNLVLINVGTNDCAGDIDPGNADVRLKVMLDDIFASIPGVTVIVSTLLKNRDNDLCATNVSDRYKSLVESYKDTRIGLADINSVMVMSDLSDDGIHPNDYGYKLFAAVWWQAISKLEDQIQPPDDSTGIDDTAVTSSKTCTKVAGNARGPIQSQKGSGYDDGNYVHNRIERGVIESARITKGTDPDWIKDAIPWHMFFANLVVGNPGFQRNEALDDWIRIYHGVDEKNTYWFRQNLGGGQFGPSTTFDVKQDCNLGPLYAFADFNNDGLDDFYCLKEGSAVHVSLNRGGNPPQFEYIGQVVPTHDGYNADDVRIADIDGDGRFDYCLTRADAGVICSRNGGTGDNYFWQGFSTPGGLRGDVFTGKLGVDKKGITFGDINGDFRSDMLYIGDGGDVETWVNSRGWGEGMVPEWRNAGTTHPGQGTPGVRGQIKFGRIYGSGRLDYIYLKEEADYYDVRVWENTGAGGTRRKADGNFYCDMRGSGADDYVWIWSDGHAAEINVNFHHPPDWGHGVSISLSVPSPRVGIHLADWNGNGRCDVLVQNKATGALTLYENEWDAAGQTLTFKNVGVVTGNICNQGWGVGIFDRGMRLADIDGDGRADPLCIEPNGRVTAWLNTKDGMQDVGQVKKTEGWDRANIRFADVEHRGRVDMIWLDKYTGSGTVMQNNGHMDGGSGSSFSWTLRGVLYSPIDRGETMHFTNQGGLGRADLLHVLPVSNTAFTYFNECGGGSGGDDGLITDPGLPGAGGDDGGDDGGGDQGPTPIPDHEPSECEAEYTDLDDVIDHLDDVPTYCASLYLMDALAKLLDSTLEKYNDVKEDYDGKFGYYAQYINDLVNPQIARWMNNFQFNDEQKIGGGNRFFNCKFDRDDDHQYDGECPVPKDIMADGEWDDPETGYDSWEITYTLRDKDGFEKALLGELGISPDWIIWEDWDLYPECEGSPGDCVEVHQWLRNFPRKADKITVGDPKKIMEDALPKMNDLKNQFLTAILAVGLSTYDPDKDLVDAAFALAVPVQMLAQAVDNMAQVKELGAEIEEKKKRETILFIVGLVLMIVPFVGEAGLAAAGFGALARLAFVGGEIANGALSVAEIIIDPNSAPVAVMGLLLGFAGRGLKTEDTMAQAAGAKWKIKVEDVASMGTTFKSIDDKIQTVISRCVR